MLQYLQGLVLHTAHAQTASTTDQLFDYYLGLFTAQFWGPVGKWVAFILLISIAFMLIRRFRGVARRPG